MATFHSGKFSRKYVRTSVYSDFARAIIPSLVYHCVALNFIKYSSTFVYKPSFEAIGVLVFGGETDKIMQVFEQNIGEYLLQILSYVSVSILVGFLFGLAILFLIRGLHLDLRFKGIRFDSEWYYALSGELVGWKEMRGYKYYKNVKKDLIVIADVLCEVAGSRVIYSGVVKEFFLDENGLDNIYLKKCVKRTREGHFKSVTGMPTQIFLIPSQTIQNVSLRYYNDRTKSFEGKSAIEVAQAMDDEDQVLIEEPIENLED